MRAELPQSDDRQQQTHTEVDAQFVVAGEDDRAAVQREGGDHQAEAELRHKGHDQNDNQRHIVQQFQRAEAAALVLAVMDADLPGSPSLRG